VEGFSAAPAQPADLLSRLERRIRHANRARLEYQDGGAGYVLRFQVNADFLARYEVQTVGSRIHQEYWIPAEHLEEFNRHLVGAIELAAAF